MSVVLLLIISSFLALQNVIDILIRKIAYQSYSSFFRQQPIVPFDFKECFTEFAKAEYKYVGLWDYFTRGMIVLDSV